MDTPRSADNFKPGGGGGAFQSDYKPRVLAAVDIVDLIGKTVSLKKRGRNYLGLCPFHSEKSPSFNVDPGKQFFHCFGCKASGNAIDFVMRRDRLEFIEALRQLGDAHNVERPNTSPQARQQAGQRQQLLDCCSTAASLFQRLLAHEKAGADGRAYLAERGFNAETIQRFQMGLAPDGWDRLLRADDMRPFGPGVMAAAGLVKARENGQGYYDTFRNRLMFPIRDEAGRVIAFGGRVMPGSTDKAKYLNSPETPLFTKHRTLFGLDLGRQKIVETRTVAVVEGYADVAMAHQFGATNVVSPLGTALTENHVAILRRFADRIVLLFDADAAGDTAVNRAVELFLTQPVEIAIASLPDGMDPDEYLLANGMAAFDTILAGATDALVYKDRQLARRLNAAGATLTDKQRAMEDFVDILARARANPNVNDLRWSMGFKYVAQQTGMDEKQMAALLKRRAEKPRPGGPVAAPVQPAEGQGQGGGYSREGGYQQQGRRSGPWQPRKPYNPFRPGDDAGGNKKFRNKQSESTVLVDHRPLSERPVQRTARETAERRILGVLLSEPGRWAGLVGTVDVADFADEPCRRMAALYWQHQQDEGEPAFNEFLDVLRAAAEPAAVDADTGEVLAGDGVDLAALAVDVVQEVEQLTAVEEAPSAVAAVLADAVKLIEEMRAQARGAKLVAQLRRTSGADAAAPTTAAESLRQLQERARRPDLRRVGS